MHLINCLQILQWLMILQLYLMAHLCFTERHFKSGISVFVFTSEILSRLIASLDSTPANVISQWLFMSCHSAAVGVLRVVWRSNRLSLHNCQLHRQMGEVVEESWAGTSSQPTAYPVFSNNNYWHFELEIQSVHKHTTCPNFMCQSGEQVGPICFFHGSMW